jgi:hypothetical protein
MKKIFLFVFLIGILIFSSKTNVFAYSALYIDGRIHGPLYITNAPKGNIDGYTLGFKFASEKTQNQLDIEYFDPGNDRGATGFLVKNAVMLGTNGSSLLYGTFTFMKLNVDTAELNKSYWFVLLGIEDKLFMNEHNYVEGGIDYAVASLGDTGYIVAKVKMNNQFDSNMGISLGCDWSILRINDEGVNRNDSGSAWTLGLFYRF